MAKKELQLDEEFQLTAPKGENQDEDSDSLGELSTNEAIVIDDLRDLIDDVTFQQGQQKAADQAELEEANNPFKKEEKTNPQDY